MRYVWIVVPLVLLAASAINRFVFTPTKTAAPPSEERALEDRYTQYMQAMAQFRFDVAYDYLSPQTKSGIAMDEWRAHWERSIDLRASESFRRADIDPAGSTAKVMSAIAIDKKDQRLNPQTWVKSEGRWFRGYIEDHPNKFSDAQGAQWTAVVSTPDKRASPSPETVRAMDGLQELLDLFAASQRAGRILGTGGGTISFEEYVALLDRILPPIQEFLKSPAAEAEPKLATLVKEASLSLEMAKINWQFMLLRGKNDDQAARDQQQIAAQINNAVDQSKHAKALVRR